MTLISIKLKRFNLISIKLKRFNLISIKLGSNESNNQQEYSQILQGLDRHIWSDAMNSCAVGWLKGPKRALTKPLSEFESQRTNLRCVGGGACCVSLPNLRIFKMERLIQLLIK